MTLSPLAKLAARAFASVARHALLYAALVAAIVALYAVIIARWHAPAADPFLAFTLEPMLDVVIVAVCIGDLRGERSARALWSRVLDRAWALLLVNLAGRFIDIFAFASLRGGIIDITTGIFLLVVLAVLVYAPVAVVIDDTTPWWALVGRAFGASIGATLGAPRFARALTLLALQFIPLLLGAALQALLASHHVAHAAFWANVPLGMILEPPLMALVAFAYFDAAGMTGDDACSE
ncbi:MAG: hypothetical protein KGN02_06845 [bacterium]|nr:hypothetical protein [bacterium]